VATKPVRTVTKPQSKKIINKREFGASAVLAYFDVGLELGSKEVVKLVRIIFHSQR
jgi:hypothetical protein